MTTPSTAYVPFQPDFEQPRDDEAETQASIDASMRRIQETTYADGGRPLRSVHAKSHGLLVGELVVGEALPAPVAQGVFARAGRHPVVLRLSTIPGDILPDDVSTPRGMAIKILGVEGERLPGSEGDTTQDFILVNGPAFQKKDGAAFARNLKLLAATTDRAEGAKQVLAAALRGIEKLVEATGHQSATLASLGGHPETHPLGDTYWSAVPMLWGPYFGKVSARPVSASLRALKDAPVDLKDRPDGLREEVLRYFATQSGEWSLGVQLCTDLETMPVEDASVAWDEAASPFLEVGRILVPPQPSWNVRRAAALDEGLAFSPWHGLAAHRPLGNVMRLRREAYARAQRFRAERLGRPLVEPTTIDELGEL